LGNTDYAAERPGYSISGCKGRAEKGGILSKKVNKMGEGNEAGLEKM
jgi:hypothetical protein